MLFDGKVKQQDNTQRNLNCTKKAESVSSVIMAIMNLVKVKGVVIVVFLDMIFVAVFM